jgi:hypothetical protein
VYRDVVWRQLGELTPGKQINRTKLREHLQSGQEANEISKRARKNDAASNAAIGDADERFR